VENIPIQVNSNKQMRGTPIVIFGILIAYVAPHARNVAAFSGLDTVRSGQVCGAWKALATSQR
jgi:hypothetical protein